MAENTASSAGRHVVVSQFGETPMDALAHHLSLEPQARPDRSTLAADDVIINVRSAAVGWVDLLMSSGQYQHMASPPYTPGLEYSGEVAWVGQAAREQWTVGDRVMADGLLTGPRSHGRHRQYGGFASWAVAPAKALHRLPEAWTYDQGANFFGNYETAWHCLVARGQLQAGETVLIHGASGSTGLAAVHVAKILGATVIATGRSPAKLAEVKAAGADHVIATAAPDGSVARFRDEVRALTQDGAGGPGVDVVYDGVGGAISLESLRCVRFGARFLLVGWASTPFVARGKGARGAPNANQLPTNLMMMKGLDVLGCPTAITTRMQPSVRKQRLGQLLQWVKEGRLRPHSGPAYPLDAYAEAMRAKWTSRFVGGCVLHPNG
ncbi:MAG: NADPH:quinone oxidoreductase family protein [Myxococcales bacterium]|nr:NADPH:quinone oxidoreductase family protein [Myxococcales bacterium]